MSKCSTESEVACSGSSARHASSLKPAHDRTRDACGNALGNRCSDQGFKLKILQQRKPSIYAQLKMAYPMDMTQVVLIGLDSDQRKDVNASQFVVPSAFPFGTIEEIVGH